MREAVELGIEDDRCNRQPESREKQRLSRVVQRDSERAGRKPEADTNGDSEENEEREREDEDHCPDHLEDTELMGGGGQYQAKSASAHCCAESGPGKMRNAVPESQSGFMTLFHSWFLGRVCRLSGKCVDR